ncbi:MAG: DUF4129 domain-containing protein [Propionicimonas sp.]|nr:DUF4129 domain-containing protein [Propionicimonas sp.]
MSPPLTPDAEEARRQLETELAKPEYYNAGGWFGDQLDRFWDWLLGDPATTSGLSDSQLLAVVVAVVVLAGLAIWAFMGPLRRERRVRSATVQAEEGRTAAELRGRAADLAEAGEWVPATMQLFRGIVRSLAERTIIDETPGITAHEAAERAAERLPTAAVGLADGADLFDALAYGDRPGGRDQYEQLVTLDAELAGLRPEPLPSSPAPPVGVTP